MRLDIYSTVTFLKQDSALVGGETTGITGIPREQVLSEQSSELSKVSDFISEEVIKFIS